MGIEDVWASVQNIIAGKYMAKMGIKVVSASVKNVLAYRNLLHPWESKTYGYKSRINECKQCSCI